MDGNQMDLMNERVSMMVGDGRGSIRGLDERGMIVMGHGRGMTSVGDGKVSPC